MLTWLMAASLGVTAGAVLGLFFFGGLWLTTARIMESDHAALLVAGSYLGRLAVLAASFYALVQIDRLVFLAALAGLLAARVVVTRAVARTPMSGSPPGHRGLHHG